MYTAKKVQIILLSFLLLLLYLLFMKNINTDSEWSEKIVKELGNDSFELVIYDEIENKQGGVVSKENIYIKSYFDENNNRYYLFLPSFLSVECSEQWKCVFNLYESIWLNGEKIAKEDTIKLEEGEYILVLENGEQYFLSILRSNNLESVFVEFESGSLEEIRSSKDNIASGLFKIFDKANGNVQYSGRVEDIHARGNLSFSETDKKSFSMKIQEADTLLGMSKSDKWLLIANSFDRTLSRNCMAGRIAEELDMQYLPESRYIDLYIDGEYQGNYQLSERVEIADGRVEIRNLEEETKKINVEDPENADREVVMDENEIPLRRYVDIDFEPSDITSGYLLELDMFHRYKREPSGFLSSRKQPVVIKSPEYAGKNQVNYIADVYQEMEDALCSEDGYNPDTGLYYYDYMDMDSFVKKYLVDEVTKNTDSSLSSFFMYIPEYDKRFYAGPIWDYDKALGANEVRDIYSMSEPKGFYASENIDLEVCAGKEFSIYYLLCQQERFKEKYKEIYFEDLRDSLEDIYEYEIVENMEDITESAVMNAVRWNVYAEIDDLSEVQKNFCQDNTNMADFLKKRVEFLDKEWSK